jgi:hypothetical protein
VAAQRVIKHIPLGMTRVAEPSTASVFPHPDNVHAFVTVRNDNSVGSAELCSRRQPC